ncbi:Lamin Tail Domain protein [anaerobic digester metagenome]
MRRHLLITILLACAILIVGCTSPSTDATRTSIPTHTVTIDTSGTATSSIASTPAPTYTNGGTTSGSSPAGAGTLRVSVLDVGQGDSILVQLPAGKTMLVDAGDTDAGDTVVSALRSRGVASIDAAVASHAHADHIGGYATVLSQFPVAHFFDSGYPSTSLTYERLLTTIDEKNIRFSTPTAGQTIDLDPAVRIDVLSPDGTPSTEIHDDMLVLRVTYGSVSFLLAGDMPEDLETRIASSLKPTTVLKVGHHGSHSSTSTAFLNAIRPEVAIISVGAGNSYGHPTSQALGRLQAVGAKVYRTDREGTVTVSTDGNTYAVTTEWGGLSAPAQAPPVATTQRQASSVRTSAPASSSSGAVTITALDLKGETVTVTNDGTSAVNLAGWRLTDEGAKHTYTFAGTTLPAGGSVTIATGTATGEIKWKSDNVWNNDGDTAYLYNAAGSLVSMRKG